MISSRSGDDLRFYDRLESYVKIVRRIQGRWFHFVVEETRPGYVHSCTVDDLEHMLNNVLFDDLAELDRLRSAGFRFQEGRRTFDAPMTLAAARTLQLYHTLPHELGHYLDYQEKVVTPVQEDRRRLEAVDRATEAPGVKDEHPIWDEWDTLFDRLSKRGDRLWDLYWKRPTSEREVYAHRAAKRMADRLRKLNVIPFERKLDPESLANDGLRWSDISEEPEPRQDWKTPRPWSAVCLSGARVTRRRRIGLGTGATRYLHIPIPALVSYNPCGSPPLPATSSSYPSKRQSTVRGCAHEGPILAKRLRVAQLAPDALRGHAAG
ncbi:MAG: hypothetical protein GY930_09465 [bacterium]|nr:hypothetical protein [bacterium]